MLLLYENLLSHDMHYRNVRVTRAIDTEAQRNADPFALTRLGSGNLSFGNPIVYEVSASQLWRCPAQDIHLPGRFLGEQLPPTLRLARRPQQAHQFQI